MQNKPTESFITWKVSRKLRTVTAINKTFCASEDCPLKLKREIPNKSINMINSSKTGMHFLLSLQLRKLRHQE